MNNTSQEIQHVVHQQMESLDDTDALSSVWKDALSSATEATSFRQQALLWGGRGKGGRGIGRRTIQPKDVIVSDVNLEYISDSKAGAVGAKILLQNATLKLLSGHVYSIIGRNGCGKSTLLRRMKTKMIPGFTSLHLKIHYVPQEVFEYSDDTPIEVVLGCISRNEQDVKDATEQRIKDLEKDIEELDLEVEENNQVMEDLCTEISALEDRLSDTNSNNESIHCKAMDVLEYFDITSDMQSTRMWKLSGGQRKKVLLACSLFCDLDIVLLDEPTNHLDWEGIIQLRGLIETLKKQNTTVVLVSHDVDLINSCASDVIHFANQTLTYYRGNYIDFVMQKAEHDLHKVRQQQALDKQREAMIVTIDNLQKQSQSAGAKGSKKVSKLVSSRKKKLEKHGIQKDEHGHRLTWQNAMTGMKVGSINTIDASTRRKEAYSQLLKNANTNVAPVPDKAVQFNFRSSECSWGEPLISAIDVSYGFEDGSDGDKVIDNTHGYNASKGILFESVDVCIDEGAPTIIMGPNGSGKTTLLKILCKEIKPLSGQVHHAHGSNIAFFDQHQADRLITDGIQKYGSNTNSISLLMQLYPEKTEQDIRTSLSDFGLNHQQASTNIQFLSGGERCRLCLAMTMISDPHCLILDEPSNHLDPESVEALAYGIRNWKGTCVLVSHDAHLIRMIGEDDTNCYVLMQKRLRRLAGGIDSYLKMLVSSKHGLV